MYRKSTLVLVGILGVSVVSSVVLTVALRVVGKREGAGKGSGGSSRDEREGVIVDGAARREVQQRGLGRLWWRRR